MKTVFSDLMLNYTKKISDFRPFAGEKGKPDFSKLSDEIKTRLIAEGEFYLQYTFPCIPPSLYLEYARTGDRLKFEAVYFKKRMALDSLVLAECVEDKGRFLDKIADGIYSLLEETVWWLPAHNSYTVRQTDETGPRRATGLGDPDHPILDLFACETGGILGMTYYLLGKQLAKVDPLIPKRMKETLESRIVRPFLTEFNWWMGDGSRQVNNWTAWCTMNVLLTTLTIGEDQETKRCVLRQAAESLDFFWDSYEEDGYCNEGPNYYSHAGLDLAADLLILNNVTKDAFEPIVRSDKFKNILLYICRVYAGNGFFINYSDAAAKLESNGLREVYAGKVFHLPQLVLYGTQRFKAMEKQQASKPKITADSKDIAHVDEDDMYGTAERTLFYRLIMLVEFDETKKKAKDLPDEEALVDGQAGDFVFENAELMTARSAHFLLACKAGWNDDSHNHNDVGSFIVYKDGQPLLIDAGVGDYTKKTFSPQRYEIWTMRSSYHNLPDIDGVEQHDGAKYKAENVSIQLESKEKSASASEHSKKKCRNAHESAGSVPRTNGRFDSHSFLRSCRKHNYVAGHDRKNA